MANVKQISTIIDALVSQASNGTLTAKDFAQFVDAGKKISDLSNADLTNGFLSALMNRIAFSVNTYRSYTGKYKELIRGSIGMGNTIEMIMQHFYSTKDAKFGAQLPANGQSVDQYEINRPVVSATYYTESNVYSITKTIERTELAKAFESYGNMDAFIQDIVGYIINSNEFTREVGRIGLVATAIAKINVKNAAATVTTKNATHYDLRAAYVAETGDASLAAASVAECLNNEKFVKFAVAAIKKVSRRLTSPSNKFSPTGAVTTFTPEGDKHLFIASDLEAAMQTWIVTNNYHPEASILENYIPVSYWQSEDAPFDIKSEGVDDVNGVIGFICDKYAIGEYTALEEMEMTPYNARGRYWNYYLNCEQRYVINEDANMVVFTVGDGQ